MQRIQNVWPICFIVFALASNLNTSSGDVVIMNDGRRFEGTILVESSIVKIDALVAGIRVTLNLPKDEIKSIDKKAVPNGFYDPPPPPPRFSLRDPLEDPDAIYLHVPIHGEFGKDVFARGVQADRPGGNKATRCRGAYRPTPRLCVGAHYL